MAGSTTGVPMSSWYGWYQTATPPPYYSKATYATTSYCTEVFKYYTTKASDFNSTTYAALSFRFLEAALSCYVEQKYYTDAQIYYTTAYATPSYNTAAPSTTPKKPPITQLRIRCLVYYIDEIKYCPARNYYQLRFIFIAISTIMSPLLRPIHLTSEVFFCMCWKIAEIQDWLKNYKCMFLFFLSTFPPADDCMMWENISECYEQIIHLAKYINKNSNSCFTFQ